MSQAAFETKLHVNPPKSVGTRAVCPLEAPEAGEVGFPASPSAADSKEGPGEPQAGWASSVSLANSPSPSLEIRERSDGLVWQSKSLIKPVAGRAPALTAPGSTGQDVAVPEARKGALPTTPTPRPCHGEPVKASPPHQEPAQLTKSEACAEARSVEASPGRRKEEGGHTYLPGRRGLQAVGWP